MSYVEADGVGSGIKSGEGKPARCIQLACRTPFGNASRERLPLRKTGQGRPGSNTVSSALFERAMKGDVICGRLEEPGKTPGSLQIGDAVQNENVRVPDPETSSDLPKTLYVGVGQGSIRC